MLLKIIRTSYKQWYISCSCWKDFIALKAEVNKLDINKLTNAPTSLNNTKTKIDHLDVAKLKAVQVDL